MGTNAEPQAGTTYEKWQGWAGILPCPDHWEWDVIGVDRLGRGWWGRVCSVSGRVDWQRINDPTVTP